MSNDNVFLAVRSPLESKCYVKVELPTGLHGRDMAKIYDVAELALDVASGRRSFSEYPTNALGEMGVRVMAASAEKVQKCDKEFRLRISGMHGAVTFVSFFEVYLIEGRRISTVYLGNELTHMYRQCGEWALTYAAAKLSDPAYKYDTVRASNLAKFIVQHLKSLKASKTPITVEFSPMLNTFVTPHPINTGPTSESKAEEPKVEEPKVEEPKVEETKVEEPKVEETKKTNEEPKVEEPKKVEEEPKAEEEEEKKTEVEETKTEEKHLYHINMVDSPLTE